MTNGRRLAAYHSALLFTDDGCVKSMHTSEPSSGYSARMRFSRACRSSMPYNSTSTGSPPRPSSTRIVEGMFGPVMPNGANSTPSRRRPAATISKPIAPGRPLIMTESGAADMVGGEDARLAATGRTRRAPATVEPTAGLADKHTTASEQNVAARGISITA